MCMRACVYMFVMWICVCVYCICSSLPIATVGFSQPELIHSLCMLLTTYCTHLGHTFTHKTVSNMEPYPHCIIYSEHPKSALYFQLLSSIHCCWHWSVNYWYMFYSYCLHTLNVMHMHKKDWLWYFDVECCADDLILSVCTYRLFQFLLNPLQLKESRQVSLVHTHTHTHTHTQTHKADPQSKSLGCHQDGHTNPVRHSSGAMSQCWQIHLGWVKS